MRTETLSIVFTDIKGYTAATSAQTHQENANMLRRTERLIAPVVRAYDGRVVKSIGDAYMLVFRSPTEAVRCAAAVQDRLHEHNATNSVDRAIHIRIAMNIGEVRVHRGDVFGEPVNIAARIESVTPADEIYLSKAIYLTMNRSDIPTEMIGDYELKGLPEPVTVYRVKKFVHLDDSKNGEVTTTDATHPPITVAGLPFGGSHLKHWRWMQWVRRAYFLMWGLGILGMASGAYMRYRPAADYTAIVNSVKIAVEQNHPVDALAAAGQLPVDALQERSVVRRYRREAVRQLLTSNQLDSADQEIKQLLKEDRRDAESLIIRGMLLNKRAADPRAALDSFKEALKLEASVAENTEMVSAVVQSYAIPNAQRMADQLVDGYLKQRAVPLMQKMLSDSSQESRTRHVLANRLEKLGAGDSVDWVALSLDDLKNTSCSVRKSGISRLISEADERAVGPLMKFAETKGCGAKEAKSAADQIMGKK